MPDGVVLLTDVYHPVGVDDAPDAARAHALRTPGDRVGAWARSSPPAATATWCRRAAAPTARAARTATSRRRPTAAPPPTGSPSRRGSTAGSGSYGASYMGFTQWALASTRPPHLQAMAVALSTSVRKFSWYPGDSLALEVIIPWDLGAVMFNKPTSSRDRRRHHARSGRAPHDRAAAPGFDHLPLGDVIRHLTGEDLPLYHDQLAHGGRDDPFWAAVDFRGHARATGRCPILLVDGWHDYPLPGVLEDYAILRDAPAPVHLRIGAGGHLGGGGEGGMTDAPLDWFDTYLRDAARPALRPPRDRARAGRRRHLARLRRLAAAGHADTVVPPPRRSARARRAPTPPSNPTGTATTPPTRRRRSAASACSPAARVDNRPLEARADVLVYTGDVLTEPLELDRAGVGGAARDVDASTTSTCSCACATCTPTARRSTCATGCNGSPRDRSSATPTACSSPGVDGVADRAPLRRRPPVRVQVSSGSHPVYARNLGTGEPAATAVDMVASDADRAARRRAPVGGGAATPRRLNAASAVRPRRPGSCPRR